MKHKVSELKGRALDWACLSVLSPTAPASTQMQHDSVQFPHLLSEIAAIRPVLDLAALSQAMQVSVDDVEDLFARAHDVWIKARHEGRSPSTDWAVGGPLLEQLIRNGFSVEAASYGPNIKVSRYKNEDLIGAYGPTVLVAACRCFLEFMVGPEIDIPDSLHTHQPS